MLVLNDICICIIFTITMEANEEELSYEPEAERGQLPEHYDDEIGEQKTSVFNYLGKPLWCQIAKSSC
jgi:hypothetical protein